MKKLIIAAAAILLCGCGTEQEVFETDRIETEPPETVFFEVSVQNDTAPDGDVSVQGIEYNADGSHISIDLDAVSVEGNAYLEEFSDISSLSIYNAGEHDLGFIGQFKSLEHISLYGCNGTESLISALEDSGIILRTLYVNDDSYSESSGDALFKAFPSTETVYMQNSDEWNNGSHNDGLQYYVSPIVGEPYEEKPLCFNFCNFAEKGYASEIKLFRRENDRLVPAELFNGESSLELGIEIMTGETLAYTVPDDAFDWENAPAGRYSAVCVMKTENETEYSETESEFFIHSKTFEKEVPFDEYEMSLGNELGTRFSHYKSPDFLDEEQLKAFESAYRLENIYFGVERDISEKYAREHTADDIIGDLTRAFTYDRVYDRAAKLYFDDSGNIIPVSAGGGTDLTLMDMEFFPIYSHENEVLFKAEILHGHEDDPYFVWFSERNFHMIRTEDGWKFDCFSLWYL